jgi:uncharacterized protein (TIGR02300 family)
LHRLLLKKRIIHQKKETQKEFKKRTIYMEFIMAKVEWGTKRICQKCDTKYYDMRKTPPVCPECGERYLIQKRNVITALAPLNENHPDELESTIVDEVLFDDDAFDVESDSNVLKEKSEN